MTDPEWARARARMVHTQINARGVTSPRVLDAMGRVPRERFLPERHRSRAYADHAVPIGHKQTMSQPYIVAVMTAALGLRGSERVLEIGTGSGYQSAVLAELAAQVWSVERIPALAEEGADRLRALGYDNVHVRAGDGTVGWTEEAPFDAILITAGAPSPPPSLLKQLSEDDGVLVAPVGGKDLQTLIRIQRSGTEFTTTTLFGCRFVPLLGQEGWTV